MPLDKHHSLPVAQQTGYSILVDSAGLACSADPQREGRSTRHG